jgi:hypothetical protein
LSEVAGSGGLLVNEEAKTLAESGRDFQMIGSGDICFSSLGRSKSESFFPQVRTKRFFPLGKWMNLCRVSNKAIRAASPNLSD